MTGRVPTFAKGTAAPARVGMLTVWAPERGCRAPGESRRGWGAGTPRGGGRSAGPGRGGWRGGAKEAPTMARKAGSGGRVEGVTWRCSVLVAYAVR